MARVLASFAACPLLCPQRHAQSKERSCATKMMYNSEALVLRMQKFPGLSASSDLVLKARPSQVLLFKVPHRKKRAIVCVPEAMLFSKEVIDVVELAQKEAGRLGHDYIGTGHLLFGLIQEKTGIAARVLKYMGITLKDVRVEVEKIYGRDTDNVVNYSIPFTRRASRVMEFALLEARERGRGRVGTEHLLLSLLHDAKGKGDASRVLAALRQKYGSESFFRVDFVEMLLELFINLDIYYSLRF